MERCGKRVDGCRADLGKSFQTGLLLRDSKVFSSGNRRLRHRLACRSHFPMVPRWQLQRVAASLLLFPSIQTRVTAWRICAPQPRHCGSNKVSGIYHLFVTRSGIGHLIERFAGLNCVSGFGFQDVRDLAAKYPACKAEEIADQLPRQQGSWRRRSGFLARPHPHRSHPRGENGRNAPGTASEVSPSRRRHRRKSGLERKVAEDRDEKTQCYSSRSDIGVTAFLCGRFRGRRAARQ